MFLSTLLIDVGDNPDRPRPGRLWLRNLYRVHQRLSMAFPSNEQKNNDPQFLKPFDPHNFCHVHEKRSSNNGFLFRIDTPPGGNPVICVQSAIKPNWDYAFQNADYLLAAPPQVKENNFNLHPGQLFRFRLRANPVRRVSKMSLTSRGTPFTPDWIGKRVPVPSEKLEDWLRAKAEKNGFHVEQITSLQTGYFYFYKDEKNEKCRLRYALYEGVLKVIEPPSFYHALTAGIGPAKAFGFGLLSIIPLKGTAS